MFASSRSFLDEIALGRHIPGDSSLHLAGTKRKTLSFAFVAISTFFYQSGLSFLSIGLGIAFLSWSSSLPQNLFWRSLRPVNLLALFTIASGAFINHQQASILQPSFSWLGLHSGGLYAGRLAVITLLTTLFFLTTQPQHAINLGIKCLRPLRLLGISAQELSLLDHLSYRFVPLIQRELKEMQRGRKARNLPQERGFIGQLKMGLDMIVFLFVGALRRAETMSFALEQRRVIQGWSTSQNTGTTGSWGGWTLISLIGLSSLLLAVDGHLL